MKIIFGFIFVWMVGLGCADIMSGYLDSNKEFTGNLYKEYAKVNSGNMVFSPLPIQLVFSLLHAGSYGKTAQEIASGLSMVDDTDKIQEVIKHLTPLLEIRNPYLLTTANKIYAANRLSVKNDYLETVRNVFKAELESMDFNNTAAAVSEINKWVEQKTNNVIKDFVNEEYINEDTVAFIVNTMYMDANWTYQFKPNNTHKQLFYTKENVTVEVDTIKTLYDFNYYYNKQLNAKFLELPLVGEDLTVTIALPRRNDGLDILENHINEVLIRPKFEKNLISLYLPKFKTETLTELTSMLQNLGIVEAFSLQANFSGITDQDLFFIDKSLQKVYFQLTEKGVSAGAATGVSISDRNPPGILFNANHPFMYFVRHKTAGVLFIGRFCDPKGTEVDS